MYSVHFGHVAAEVINIHLACFVASGYLSMYKGTADLLPFILLTCYKTNQAYSMGTKTSKALSLFSLA